MESHDVSRRRMLWSGETCATYLRAERLGDDGVFFNFFGLFWGVAFLDCI